MAKFRHFESGRHRYHPRKVRVFLPKRESLSFGRWWDSRCDALSGMAMVRLSKKLRRSNTNAHKIRKQFRKWRLETAIRSHNELA